MRGTLDSPGNMIEVVLRILLTASDREKGWDVELKFSTEPCSEAKQPPHSGTGNLPKMTVGPVNLPLQFDNHFTHSDRAGGGW